MTIGIGLHSRFRVTAVIDQRFRPFLILVGRGHIDDIRAHAVSRQFPKVHSQRSRAISKRH